MRAVPRIQTSLITLSTFMPEDADRAGLSETARIALPSRVFISTTQATVMVTRAMHDDRQLLVGQADGAVVACGPG